LDWAGEAVIFLGEVDKRILTIPKLVRFSIENETIVLKKGNPNSCYNNVDKLAKENPDLTKFEGFALSEDGVWRGHAWLYDFMAMKLIETTLPRLAYCGVPTD